MALGDNILKIRTEKYISGSRFAKQIGVSRVQLRNYEKNINQPGLEVLHKICKALNVTEQELRYGKKEEEADIKAIIDYRDEVISLLKDRVERLEKDLEECKKKKGL